MAVKLFSNYPFALIIQIRFLQIYREIKDVGIFRAMLLILILLPLLFFFLYTRLPLPGYNHMITGGWLFILYFIHRNRRDDRFLQKMANSVSLVYLGEYLMVSLPVILMLLITHQIWHPLMLVLGLICISNFKPQLRIQRTYSKVIRYLPSGLFEWQSGVRKNLMPVALFYIIGLMGVFKIWFSLIAVCMLTLLICSFYGECEPVKMLEASEKKAVRFLWDKIRKHISWTILFMLPLFLIALVNTDYWSYILLCFPMMINLVISAILLKYAYYKAGNTSGIHQLIGTITIILSVILPLAFLVFLANFYWYKKALHNLNQLLHAYHS